MTAKQPRESACHAVFQVFNHYRRRWLIPMAIGTVVTMLYTVTRPPTWEATQAVLIQDVAAVNAHKQDQRPMTLEETIQRVAHHPDVIRAAADRLDEGSVSTRELQRIQQSIHVRSAHGSEQSDVLNICLQSTPQQQASDLVSHLADEIDAHLRQLRTRQSESQLKVLQQKVAAAEQDLDEAAAELEDLELEAGDDLVELRLLVDGQRHSHFQQVHLEAQAELRRLEKTRRDKRQLLDVLSQTPLDPQQITHIPNELLDAHPGFRQYKDQLIEAQLRASQMMAQMSPRHPHVRAAVMAERELRSRLKYELSQAAKRLDTDLSTLDRRIARQRKQLSDSATVSRRMNALRMTYQRQLEVVVHTNTVWQELRNDLRSAELSLAASAEAPVLLAAESADTGTHPIGPHRMVIVVAGTMVGLLVGIGILVTTVPAGEMSTAIHSHPPQPPSETGVSFKQTFSKLTRFNPSRN